MKNFFYKHFWEYYLASFCRWISSSCENHYTLMPMHCDIVPIPTRISVIFATGTTVHAQWLMTNPLSQPFRPVCRASESQDEHWTIFKIEAAYMLYLFHSSAMLPANHPNLATPHSLLSLYNDVFWKENQIPGHFAIAFSRANKSVSSWWPYIEILWVKGYLTHSHWWSLGYYIKFFNREFSHIIWDTFDNFLIELKPI